MPTRVSLNPKKFLPLTPAMFHVLLALVGGERHGYSIMKHVVETTDGQVKMGPGTLYGTLKRLLRSKLIEESDERPDPDIDDQRRHYYRLTTLGHRVVEAEVNRYSQILGMARRIGVGVIEPREEVPIGPRQ